MGSTKKLRYVITLLSCRSERSAEVCEPGPTTSSVRPAEPAQRRYEALGFYFVDGASAADVGAASGTRQPPFTNSRLSYAAGVPSSSSPPSPARRDHARPRRIRDQVLALRAQDRSVTEIAERLSAEGTPVSAQTVWAILHAEGLERLPRRRPVPARRRALDPVKARPIESWPAGAACACDHAGLYLLLPADGRARPGHPDRPTPATPAPGCCQRCTRSARCCWSSARAAAGPPTPFPLGADPGLGLALGLAALPKATHLTSYSYRVRRTANLALLTGLARRCRESASTRRGRVQPRLPRHPPPRRRGPRSRSTTCRPLANAPAPCSPSSPKTTPPPRWSTPTPTSPRPNRPARSSPSPTTGAESPATDPGLLVFDSQADHLQDARRTRRPRHHLPHPAPTRPQASSTPSPRCPPRRGRPTTSNAAGRYRHPQIHEEIVHLNGIDRPAAPDRHPQHRPRPTHPADHQRPRHPRQGPVRPLRRTDDHRERTRRRHLRVPPQRPRPPACPSTSTSTPPSPCSPATATGSWPATSPATSTPPPTGSGATSSTTPAPIVVADDHVRVDLAVRTYTPVLIDAGYPELDLPVPWWGGRTLRFGFPPR